MCLRACVCVCVYVFVAVRHSQRQVRSGRFKPSNVYVSICTNLFATKKEAEHLGVKAQRKRNLKKEKGEMSHGKLYFLRTNSWDVTNLNVFLFTF